MKIEYIRRMSANEKSEKDRDTVKQRVGNETTGVNCFVGGCSEGGTVTVVEGAEADEFSFELV